MSSKYSRFPLNVAGDFYVANGWCMACEAPEHEAPDLMAHEPGSRHCYFRRQPETAAELAGAVMAVAVGCCGAVRYAGTNPSVIHQLREFGSAAMSDHEENA
jgi:hypothetical protein